MTTPDGLPGATASSLVGRTFSVVEIAGAPVLEGTHPDLVFGADGRLSGLATINRVSGAYEVDGDTVTLGPLASTMMAGVPAAMEQEHRLLTLLGSPLVVRAGGGPGELTLDDGQLTMRLVEGAPDTSS